MWRNHFAFKAFRSLPKHKDEKTSKSIIVFCIIDLVSQKTLQSSKDPFSVDCSKGSNETPNTVQRMGVVAISAIASFEGDGIEK